MSRSPKSRELTYLFILIFSLATIAVLYLAKSVVVPLALSILFSFLLSPLVTLLERIRLPRVLAVIVVILAAAMAVGTIGWTVFNQLVSVTDHMADFTYNINRKVDALKPAKSTSFTRAEQELNRLGQQIGTLQLDGAADQSPHPKKPLGASADHPVAVQEVRKSDRLDTIHGVLGSMVAVFLVVVFTFFMLLQREDLRKSPHLGSPGARTFEPDDPGDERSRTSRQPISRVAAPGQHLLRDTHLRSSLVFSRAAACSSVGSTGRNSALHSLHRRTHGGASTHDIFHCGLYRVDPDPADHGSLLLHGSPDS